MKILYGGLPGWKQAGYNTSSNNTAQTPLTSRMVEGVVESKEFIKAARSGDQDIVLLDVRSYEEFEQGVILGAFTIPADEISDRILEIPVGKEVLIYCKSGIRAEMVYVLLKDKGIAAKFLNKPLSIDKDGTFSIGNETR